jgi:hypothetical protein
MKRGLFVLITVAFLLLNIPFVASLFAAPIPITVGDTIRISDYTTGLSDNAYIPNEGYGGAFLARPEDTSKSWDNFITFCLEADEYLDFSSIFKVGNISDTAQNGGVNTDSGDELSEFTAYLYTQAVNHVYADSQLDDVQYAIWHEEQEIGQLSGDVLDFYNEQKANFIASRWSGLGNVRVINLMDASGRYLRQDLLVSVNPVPEPATMLLLGAGLIGLAGVGRKKLLKK